MSFPLQKIGKHTEKIETWNPNKSISDDLISYIDLSSVDKDKKKIDLSWIQKVLPKEAPSRARQIVKAHDILVSTVRPNLNGIAVVPEKLKDATASTGYCVLRAKTTTLFSQYLFYWLQTKFFINDMISKSTGANYPAVSDKIIKESFIPLPALAEQKQIAVILDAADSLRQKDQQLVEHYIALSQSLFFEMFGDPVLNPLNWPSTKVENVCTKIYGGGTPTKTIPKYFMGDIPWVTPKDMKKQYISDSLVRINHEAIQNSSAKLIPENSVLMVIRSGVLKHTLPLAISTREITINQDLKAFIPDLEQTNSAYLLHFFKAVESFLLGKVRAVTADNLEFNQIKKLSFPAPPLKLQNQFAERIAIIEKQKQQAQANLQKSEALFNSLLQRAFTGELTADKAA